MQNKVLNVGVITYFSPSLFIIKSKSFRVNSIRKCIIYDVLVGIAR